MSAILAGHELLPGGEIVTVKCFQETPCPKEQVELDGRGKVMVVRWRWFLASCAAWRHIGRKGRQKNGWEGIIVLRLWCGCDVLAQPLWATRRWSSHPMKDRQARYRRSQTSQWLSPGGSNPSGRASSLYADNTAIIGLGSGAGHAA